MRCLLGEDPLDLIGVFISDQFPTRVIAPRLLHLIDHQLQDGLKAIQLYRLLETGQFLLARHDLIDQSDSLFDVVEALNSSKDLLFTRYVRHLREHLLDLVTLLNIVVVAFG